MTAFCCASISARRLLALAALGLPLLAPAADLGWPATPDEEAELADALAQPVYGSSRLGAASKRAEDLVTAAGAAVVRTGGEIRAQGYRTLGEVLESLPGVHLRYDRAYLYAGLRGLTRPGDYSSRLLVLVDSVRVNDPLFDAALIGREFPVDISLIDRVEFIPGPGSSLYGSNAVAGVVNVITRMPAQLAGSQASLSVGSQRQRKATASWGGSLGDSRLLLALSTENRPGGDLRYAEYASQANPEGIAHQRDGERTDKLFAKLQQGGLRVNLSLSERRKDIPTGAYGIAFDTPAPWTDRYAGLSAAYTRALGPASTLELLGHHARYSFLADTQTGEGARVRDHNASHWFNGELRWRYTGWAGHRLTLGVETQRNRRQDIRVDTVSADGDRWTQRAAGRSHRQGLYLVDEWALRPDLLLTVGLRADRRTDGSHGTSPRLAAIWSPTPAWTFKWLSGTAYREPNFSELAYADAVQRRPESLEVESLRAHELVTLWRPTEAWQLQGSLFRARMSDVIELAARQDRLLSYTNRSGVQAAGASVEATWVSRGGLQLRGSATYQRAHDVATGQTLSDLPPQQYKLALTSPTPVQGLTVGLNLVRVGDRRAVGGGSAEAYQRVNTRLSYAPPGSAWDAAFTVYNLLNTHYADPAGPEHRQSLLAQDGRSWALQVGRRF